MNPGEPSQATIETRDNGLALVGDFDIFLSEQLRARIDACATDGGRIVLDLRRCSYIDSTILTVIVRAVNKYAGRLEMIVPASGNVARILSITKLDGQLPLIEERHDAAVQVVGRTGDTDAPFANRVGDNS